MVKGFCLLAAHMGFVIGTEPEMLGALIGGKLSGRSKRGVRSALAVLYKNRRHFFTMYPLETKFHSCYNRVGDRNGVCL